MNPPPKKWNQTGRLTLLLLLLTIGTAAKSAPANPPLPEHFRVRYHGQFSELPVGAVQPRGWLQSWLERQAQGLTGHPENLAYPYDTCLYAGEIPPPLEKSSWWSVWWPYEQTGYFVDGTARLSRLLNDPALDRRRDENLNYILAHSSGTNLGPSRWSWANAVVGRALLAEFSATKNPQIADTLQNWLLTSADQIAKGDRAGANFEEAYYLYGLTGDRRLLELCRKVQANYLTATNSFCTAEKIQSGIPFHEHGVTAAELLKSLPLTYLYTGDPQALRLARRAYEKILAHSLMPDGGIVSSEYTEANAFDSLHETCDLTDWPWSMGYLLMATGETKWADLIERTTFNALPGAVTKNFKQLQYFSGVNQTLVTADANLTAICSTRITYRAAHDTECCAGNVNRAMPNFVIRMWMRAADDGLAAVFYGPGEVTAAVRGQTVRITEETDYPFRSNIQFHVAVAQPVKFNLHLRIPEWCRQPALRVNGKIWRGQLKPGTFAVVSRQFQNGDTVSLELPMPVRTESWLAGRSICVTRGPLVYALKIDARHDERFTDPADIKKQLLGHDIRGFPAVEFFPQSDWRYGLASALTNDLAKITVTESPVTGNPFLENETPVRLELPLQPLPAWTPTWTNGVRALPAAAALTANGSPVTMTLLPYGATYLRLTTLPLIPSPTKTNP